MGEKTAVRGLEATVVVLIVLLLLAELLVYYSPAQPSIANQERLSVESNSTVLVHSELRATFAAHASAVDFARSTNGSFPVIYYYFDPTYPMSYSDLQDWYGLTQHLTVVAGARGYSLHLQLVNAAQLIGLLQDPASVGDLLIMASGILPATIYTGQTNLLKPWLQSGGTLLWLGAQIGFYSGMGGTTSATPGPGTPGRNGTAQFLNLSWLGGNTTLYDGSSPLASDFAFQYPYGIPRVALNASAVANSGGIVLGPVEAGFTNFAEVRVGKGALVDLAAPPYDVVRLSISLVNLLQAGVLVDPPILLDNQTMTLAPAVPFVTNRWVTFPASLTTLLSAEFCRFTAQIDYLATFASTSCLPI